MINNKQNDPFMLTGPADLTVMEKSVKFGF